MAAKLIIFIIFIQLATQFDLYDKKHNNVGYIAIYKETLYIKFYGEKAEDFKITFKKLLSMSSFVYYVENDKARGWTYIGDNEVKISLFIKTTKQQYYREFSRRK